jgi:ABC-type phosphate transport system permease subunit
MGWKGFIFLNFYALSDQIGANISGLIFLRRKEGTWRKTINQYVHNPVMMTSLAIILIVPIGLFLIRLMGFSPTTQIYTALETIVANLCWVPPLVGWLRERSKERLNHDRR